MNKKEIEEAYTKYEPLLHNLSHKTAERCGRPEKECFGEACFLFMKATESYKKNKGSFGTWVFKIVKNGLITWATKNPLAVGWLPTRYSNGACNVSKDMYDPDYDLYPELADMDTNSPDKQMMFKEWLSGLTDECREVANIILNGPAEILEFGEGNLHKITAQAILKFLRSKGWGWIKARRTIHDLKDAVATL